MKRIFIILFIFFVLTSCKPLHQVVVEHVIETHVVDSVAVRDSVVTVPKEVYTNVSWSYEPLHLETSLAAADVYVDSLWLRGTIWNKHTHTYEKETVDHYYTKDSLVYVDKPVPYPVEKVVKKNAAWWVWVWAILASGGLFLMFWRTFRSKLMKLFTPL